MTLEIDEYRIATNLDGIRNIADMRESAPSTRERYLRMYEDYLRAYSDIGLYITTVDGSHVVIKVEDMHRDGSERTEER